MPKNTQEGLEKAREHRVPNLTWVVFVMRHTCVDVADGIVCCPHCCMESFHAATHGLSSASYVCDCILH